MATALAGAGEALASVVLAAPGLLVGLAWFLLQLPPEAGRIADTAVFIGATGFWAVPCAIWLQRRRSLFR